MLDISLRVNCFVLLVTMVMENSTDVAICKIFKSVHYIVLTCLLKGIICTFTVLGENMVDKVKGGGQGRAMVEKWVMRGG